MSLVFLLVVTLITYVGAELRLTDFRKQKIVAESNARMGLMVAIGELQKHLGPDTRVTATADLLDERIEAEGETYSYSSPSSNGIDLNNDNQIDAVPFGQRHWTGVWKHRALGGRAVDPAIGVSPKNYETGNAGHKSTTYDPEFDGHPEAEIAWLVSGNEGHKKKLGLFEASGRFANFLAIPDGISQKDRSAGLGGVGYGNYENAWEDYRHVVNTRIDDYDHPLKELPDPDADDSTVWLLKHPVLGSSYDPGNPEDWKGHLVAEPVKVSKSYLVMENNGQSGSPTLTGNPNMDKPKKSGSYAYWVSDEGVKTKVNIVNPNKGSTDAETMRDNLLVATEPNLEIETGFDITFPSGTGNRQSLSGLNDLSEFGEDREKVSKNYHSLTTDSFGVLADVRTGGLKRDISSAFELEDDEFDDAGYADWLFQERVHYQKNFRPMDPDPDNMIPVPGHPDRFSYKQRANDWLDQANNAFINDYRVMTAGPKWSVLRDFHNLHENTSLSASAPTISTNLYPDCGNYKFPRRKGDNNVIFGSTLPHSPGGFMNSLPIDIIKQNYNYFSDGGRPEPENHAITPVLVEVKYSQEAYIDEDGTLCLAMFPAFALWNPYDVAIQLGSDEAYELDLKLKDVHLQAFNTKDWEIYKKWRIHQEKRRVMAKKAQKDPSPTAPKPRPIQIAQENRPALPNIENPAIDTEINVPFIDLNGNGRRDPGEYREPPHQPPHGYGLYPGGGGGGGGGGGFNKQMIPHMSWMWSRRIRHFADEGGPAVTPVKAPHATERNPPFTTFAKFRLRKGDFPNFPDFYPFNDFDQPNSTPKAMRIPRFHPLGIMLPGQKRYVRNYSNKGKHLGIRDAPIRLSAKNVRLEPGEKAYFTPAITTNVNPADTIKTLVLRKATEAAGHHLRFKAPATYFKIDPDDPVTLRMALDSVTGYSRGDKDDFGASNEPTYGDSTPNGVILYLRQGNIRRPIKKINKNFDLRLNGNPFRSFDKASDLMGFQNKLLGNYFGGVGFRLRWKLPGTSTKMTFHEFNPRALVDGYQDGSGDLWEIEEFWDWDLDDKKRKIRPKGWKWKNHKPKYYNKLDPKREIGLTEDGNGTFDDFVLADPPPPPWIYRPYSRNVPRVNDAVAYFGHFHEDSRNIKDGLGNPIPDNKRFSSPRVSLFEVPRSPMLSIMQLRHANMNPYSHSPAYVLGNSYATPQVGRYKKWGRVRRLLFQPDGNQFEHPLYQYKRFEVEYRWAGQVHSFNLYPWDEVNWAFNMGTIRDTHSEHNHQNITLDFSYYANEALFDGFFLTGVAKNHPEKTVSTANANVGERFSPFRNPRLKAYQRRGTWEKTEYAEKSESADVSDNYISKHQTMAADLMVEGAFNVNSTSVDSWVAHLAALKGQAIKIHDLKDGMKVNGSTKTWNDSSVTPFLRVVEPTGEAVPAQGSPNLDNDFWTGFVTLTDSQIRLFATKLVEEVKLRGPFLSLSDFVNRRITRMDFPTDPDNPGGGNVSFAWLPKQQWPNETTTTVQGLRGPVQAAISKSKLNQGGFTWSPKESGFPEVPAARFNLNTFRDSSFGLHAVSMQEQYAHDPLLNVHGGLLNNIQSWGRGIRVDQGMSEPVGINVGTLDEPQWVNDTVRWKRIIYSEAFKNGEAPENLLAVENLATGANMPGWLTQADVLSPLAPILTARSDTFVVRTYGESPTIESAGSTYRQEPIKRWCEVTVQRLPDYVKSQVDAPHHRPHEPFADENFDGVWSSREEWLDLNLNRETVDREGTLIVKPNGPGTSPDLPGGNDAGKFKAGISSDLKLEPDPELEKGISSNQNFVSTKGINQRFGRKFRIVKFRWLMPNEV